MKTIEEHAKIIVAKKAHCKSYEDAVKHMGSHCVEGVLKSVIDVLQFQQKIDIEKACELYEEALYQAKRTGIHGIPQMVNMFKQAMEE